MAQFVWVKGGIMSAKVTPQVWREDIRGMHGTTPPYVQRYDLKPEDESLPLAVLERLYPFTPGPDAKVVIEKKGGKDEANG